MIGYQIILAIMPLWLFSHDVSPDSSGEIYKYVCFTLLVLYPDRTFFMRYDKEEIQMDFDRMQNEILKNLYKEKDALTKRKSELQNELEAVDSNLNKVLSAEKKLMASFEKLGKEVSEWECLSATLNTVTKKRRKKKTESLDGSAATDIIEQNIHQDVMDDDIFNPFGE